MVDVIFTKGGKPYYYSTQVSGYVGLLTAMKPVCVIIVKFGNSLRTFTKMQLIVRHLLFSFFTRANTACQLTSILVLMEVLLE